MTATEVNRPDDFWRASAVGHRAFRGGLAGAIGFMASILVTFAVTPYILDRIGPTGYGLFILVSSLVAYGAILDLGIGGALVKLIAEYRARGDEDAVKAVVATAVRLYSALALICLGLAIVAAVVVPDAFRIPEDAAPTARLVVLLMGANLALSIFATPAMSAMAGLQRYDVQNVIGTTGVIANALATVAVLALGGGVVGMVAVNIPITIAMRAASAWYVRRSAPALSLRWSGATKPMARRITSLSASIFAAQASGPLQKKTDEIVIAAFLVVSSVTPYALARKLSEVAHQVTRQFVKVLLPIASGLDARSERSRVRELYVASTRATLAIFLSVALVLVVYPDLILTVWVGAEYASAAPLVAVLTIASVTLTSVYPAGSILQGMGRFQLVAISSILSGLTNLGLSIYLVQNIGVLGVALGTLIPTTIETMLVVTPYTMRLLSVSLREALTRIWVPTAFAALPAVGVMWLFRSVFDLTALPTLLVAAIFGSGTYLVAYFAFPQTSAERSIVVGILKRIFRRDRLLPVP